MDVTGLKIGQHADLTVLDMDDPMLAGHSSESILDALVYSGLALPISHVMVDGKWRVVDGVHVDIESIQTEYRDVVNKLWAAR